MPEPHLQYRLVCGCGEALFINDDIEHILKLKARMNDPREGDYDYDRKPAHGEAHIQVRTISDWEIWNPTNV